MKKTDFLNKLSDMTKIPADKLKEVITSDAEDIDIELAEFHIYSNDELDSFKRNMTSEASKTAIEMAVKEQRNYLKETFGADFDFQGKTMSNLVETAIKAGEKKAGIKPSEQMAEKDKVIKALQENVQQLESQNIQVLNEKNQIIMDNEINSTITKAIPTDLETIWSTDEIAELWKKNYKIFVEDGKKIVKKGEEILRDKKTQEPLPVDAVVHSWLLEKGVTKKTAQGRGEGDTSGQGKSDPKFNKIGDVIDHCIEKGMTNDQQVAFLQKVMKENPDLKE